jgi:non-specific serine/threonine protein kinase
VFVLGDLLGWHFEWAAAKDLAEQALEMARALDDPQLVAQALGLLSGATFVQGDPDGALGLAAEAVEVARSVADDFTLAEALFYLASATQVTDEDRSRQLYQECLASCRQAGDVLYACLVLGQLALPELRRGETQAAARHLDEAVTKAEQIGAVWLLTVQSANLGGALLSQGEVTAAATVFRTSLITARRCGLRDVAGCALTGLACCTTRTAELDRAVQLHGAGDAILERTEHGNDMLYLAEQIYADDKDRLRGTIGNDAFERAYRSGAELTFEQALDTALGRYRHA